MNILIVVVLVLLIVILYNRKKEKENFFGPGGAGYSGIFPWGFRYDPEIYYLSGGSAAISTNPYDTTYPYQTPVYDPYPGGFSGYSVPGDYYLYSSLRNILPPYTLPYPFRFYY